MPRAATESIGANIPVVRFWEIVVEGTVLYGGRRSIFLRNGDITGPSFRNISRWSLWTGVPMMVTSGLLLFFMNWKSVVRAFSTIGALLKPGDKRRAKQALARKRNRKKIRRETE